MSIKIQMRSHFSVNHLSAASFFASRALEIEEKCKQGTMDGAIASREQQACIASSIMMSVAFLEATINELFDDCTENHEDTRLAPLPAKQLMATLWNRNIPRTARYRITEKFDIALELNGKNVIDPSKNPVQATKLLIELRNALVHYEPETITAGASDDIPEDEVHKFERKFKGLFTENPLTGPGNPFYPHKLLGGGCAVWAVKTAVSYADEFYNSLGLVPTYEHMKNAFLKNI